ncbi:MAG TPA: class I SAM-dependent methyltransferase [Bacilli bacterium]|nr:class I SAM-dependent methyltransferase [Bacilli bacterium]
MASDLSFWNGVFERVQKEGVSDTQDDLWLTSYIPLLRGQKVERILEIGCGVGRDTLHLAEAGFEVTATDFSASALAMVREKLPDVSLLLHDTREPFPFVDGSFDLVLASLSLHYFDRSTTKLIVEEIKRLLRPRGLLLYRVNSINDHSFGAGQGDLLEPDFFLKDGIRRRYFSLDACRETFQGWDEFYLEEKTVDRYENQKVLCEGLVRKMEA